MTGDDLSESLSEEGRRRCEPLAALISAYEPSRIFTSTMPRAAETGQLIAARLGISSTEIAGLEEHKRDHEASPTEFRKRIMAFFSEPGARVFGYESAIEAGARLGLVLDRLVSYYPGQTVAAVSHGTVISAFLAGITKSDGFKIWSRLRQPAFAALSVPDFELLHLVEEVSGESAGT